MPDDPGQALFQAISANLGLSANRALGGSHFTQNNAEVESDHGPVWSQLMPLNLLMYNRLAS
jgi:hypothetical protein